MSQNLWSSTPASFPQGEVQPVPDFLYQISDLLPLTIFLPSPSLMQLLMVSLRQPLRHQGRTQERCYPLTDLQTPVPVKAPSLEHLGCVVPICQGSCHPTWPLAGLGHRGLDGSQTTRLPLLLSLPAWAYSARVLALPSCLPGTEDLCRTLWGSGWEVSLFTPPPRSPMAQSRALT